MLDVTAPSQNNKKTVGGVANLRPFQKGRSGNPGGRPKLSEDIKVLARSKSKKAFERIVELIDSDDERVAIMAAKEVLDRAYGKAGPAPDEDAANSKALTINIVRYTDGNQPPQQLDATTVSVRTLAAPGDGR